jgi:hypothetical protein
MADPENDKRMGERKDAVRAEFTETFRENNEEYTRVGEIVKFYDELADSLQVILAIDKERGKLSKEELENKIRYFTTLQNIVKQKKAELDLEKLQQAAREKTLKQLNIEQGYERGKQMTRFYRADRPHQLGMIVGKATDAVHRTRLTKNDEYGREKGEGNGAAVAQNLVGVVGKTFSAVGSAVKNAATAVLGGGKAPEAGTASEGVAGKTAEAAKTTQPAGAEGSAAGNGPTVGDAVGEQMAGMTGMIGDGLGIGKSMLSVLTKLFKIVEQASPYLQSMMKLIVKAIMLTFMPIGNIIATLLRPLAVKLMMQSADAIKKSGGITPGGSLSDKFVSDVLDPMFQTLVEIFIKLAADILPPLVYGFLAALVGGIGDLISGMFNKAGDKVTGSDEDTSDWAKTFSAIAVQIGSMMLMFAAQVLTFIDQNLDIFVTMLSDIGTAIVTFVTTNLSVMLSDLGTVADAFVSWFNEGFDSISTIFGQVADSIVSWFDTGLKSITEIASKFSDSLLIWFSENLSKVTDLASDLSDSILTWFKMHLGLATASTTTPPATGTPAEEEKPVQLSDVFSGIASSILKWFKDNINDLGDVITNIATTIIKWVTTNINDLGDLLTDISDEITDFISKNIGDLISIINGIVSTVLLWFTNNAWNFIKIIEAITSTISTWMKNNADKCGQFLYTIANAIEAWFKGAGNAVMHAVFSATLYNIGAAIYNGARANLPFGAGKLLPEMPYMNNGGLPAPSNPTATSSNSPYANPAVAASAGYTPQQVQPVNTGATNTTTGSTTTTNKPAVNVTIQNTDKPANTYFDKATGKWVTVAPTVTAPNTALGSSRNTARADAFMAGGDTHFSPFSPKNIVIGEGSKGESVVTDPQLVGMLRQAVSSGYQAAMSSTGSRGERSERSVRPITVNLNGPIFGDKDLEAKIRAIINKVNRESGWY